MSLRPSISQRAKAAWLACPRRCAVCRKPFTREALLRVVRTPSGEVCVDLEGKRPGRGAYLCNSAACRAKAGKKGLGGALKAPIPPTVTAWLGIPQPAGMPQMS